MSNSLTPPIHSPLLHAMQLQNGGMRQFGFAASAALRAGRAACRSGTAAVTVALRRPQGMAGSSLARQAGRRLKSTATEFHAVNAAEVGCC